jgi:hypothetical protein
MLFDSLSSRSAVWRWSEAFPRVMPLASWIIMVAFGAMTTSSPACAMNDAAEAASPST